MSHFHNLPAEIIVMTFKSLDNIDDALHLAQSCKLFHNIFDPTSTRLAVFKSIIIHAPHHEHDIALSKHVDFYGQFSSEFYSSLPIIENPVRRRSLVGQFLGHQLEVSNDMVWDIVSRWHGSRILFDFYCDREVNKAFVNSTFPYFAEIGMLDTTDKMAKEASLPPPAGHLVAEFEKMAACNRHESYQRFYKAVTRHWLSTELLWLVRTQYYPNAAAFDEAFDRIWAVWSHNPTRPLEEKIDIIEVVDFVWGFLGRKAFQVSQLSDWFEGFGEEILHQYIDDQETEVGNWGFFVRNVFQYLRPPHIIELLLSNFISSGWQFDKPDFLLQLGLFDTSEGILADASNAIKADTWVPITAVEIDMESSFSQIENWKPILASWERYRYSRWPREARARVFLENQIPERIIRQVQNPKD